MIKNSQKSSFYLTIILIVVLQFIIAFQGFDFCDEGFSLTFYQQIFNSPESVEYNFVYWLSGIVGGAWYSLFPEGGILWFRILAIIVNTCTFLISYHLLNKYLKQEYVIIGLCMVFFINSYGFLAFYHNQLTALIAVCSAYFLIHGIHKRNIYLIGVSGLLVGINIFSRLPNVTLLVWVLVIPFAGFLNKENFLKSVKPMLFFILGAIVGFSLVILLMSFIGHLEIMKRASHSLIDLGGTEGSTHNVATLFKTYFYNYKKVTFYSLVLLCVLLSHFVLIYRLKNKRNLIKGCYLLTFLFLFFLFQKGIIHIVYAMAYLGALWVLFTKQDGNPIKVLAFLGCLMMLFLPLGSAGGMYDSGYMWVWLTMPFFIHFLSQLKDMVLIIKNKIVSFEVTFSIKMIKNVIALVTLSYFISKAYSISQEAYFDNGSRFLKTYSIESKFAKGIYTTNRRAAITNELLFHLDDYVKPNDYLLAYDCLPMLHFLTQTKPYMYNPWVWVYDSRSFKEKMEKAEIEISTLPIVVQQKFSTISEFSGPQLDYMSEMKEDTFSYNRERTTAMNAFVKRNNYKIVWSNEYFDILRAPLKRTNINPL